MAIRFFLTLSFLALSGVLTVSLGQSQDITFPRTRAEGIPCTKEENICEQLEKLRIEHEKKEHGELVSRAEQALRLSEELERSITQNPELGEKDLEKLQSFEKLVRKIRSELGAKDSDSSGDKGNGEDDNFDDDPEEKPPNDVVSAFKSLRQSTIKLVDEIRKSTRFTISATAIRSSNAVLKLTRAIRFWR